MKVIINLIQILILITICFPSLFTTYYIIKEDWFNEFRNWNYCYKDLLNVLFLTLFNYFFGAYLFVYYIHKALCYVITGDQTNSSFSLCKCVYLVFFAALYVWGFYTLNSEECTSDMLVKFPNLYNSLACFFVSLIVLACLFVILCLSRLFCKEKKNTRYIRQNDDNSYVNEN